MREAIYDPTTMPLGGVALDRRSEKSPSDIMTFLWDLWMVARLRAFSPYCGSVWGKDRYRPQIGSKHFKYGRYGVLVANFPVFVAVVGEDRVSALDGCP